MRRVCSSLLMSLLIASSSSAVTMAWTPIGNPGNAGFIPSYGTTCGPNRPCGAVGYSYSIGTYDVTNAQYTEFLNAKAASDPLGLYNTNMGQSDPANLQFGGITRTGSPGSYSYSAIAGRADMPVNWVSFYDALRFGNWMNNGQGNGNTETGSYTLLGGTPTPSNGITVTRNAGATIALPSEDEWFKAAYYDAASTSYFEYPAGSNAPITCSMPTATANSANCNGAANPPPYGDLTNVGSYTGSASPYGTFDQGGNVWQWNEAKAPYSDYARGTRGGSFGNYPFDTSASERGFTDAIGEDNGIGFRLAMIPEPSSGLLVITGLLGLAVRRRARA